MRQMWYTILSKIKYIFFPSPILISEIDSLTSYNIKNHINFIPFSLIPNFYNFALLLSIIPLIRFFIFAASYCYIFYAFSILALPERARLIFPKSAYSSIIPKCDLKSNLSSLYLSILFKLAIGSEKSIDFCNNPAYLTRSGWNGSIDYSFLLCYYSLSNLSW